MDCIINTYSGGHTEFFFPVARHCVYCAREAKARGYSDEVALACLLHDASEAYMVDLPPVHIELEYKYEPFEKSEADYMEIFEEMRRPQRD